jgi:hypothetical protein
MEALATSWEREADVYGPDAAAHHLRGCARALRAALATDAPTTTAPTRVNVTAAWAIEYGITYGSGSTGDVVCAIPDAGPGMWRVVGIGATDPAVTALWVVPA